MKGGRDPARVMNVRSRRRRTPNKRIRIDRLLRSAVPKILIKRRLGGIGDVLMTTPLLKALKELIPRCEITYATDMNYSNGALGQVIQHNPYVDRLIPNEMVRETEYDYAVDITATGLNREKSGSVPPNRINMFAEEVGISVDGDPVPVYEVTRDEQAQAVKEIEEKIGPREGKRIIALQARSNDARRTWPLDHVQNLADLLTKDENVHVLLFDWGNTTKRWQKTNDRVHLLLDRTLIDTAGLIEQADIVVCPDSSMLHLAGALNKKIVTVFGPIPPESRINHYANATAITLDLPCRNCVVGDSLILTDAGYKQIQDVQVGEKAYTTDGYFNTITEIHQNNRDKRDLVELTIFGSNETVTTTNDHKLLVSKRTYSWKKEDWKDTGNRRRIPKLSDPEWTKVKDIEEGDFCCMPIPKETETTSPLLGDEELAWLVGLFVAEGWTRIPKGDSRNYDATLSINKSETRFIEKIKDIVQKHPKIFTSNHHNKGFVRTRPNSRGDSTVVIISNKKFVTELHKLFNIKDKGTINSASKKKVPPILFGHRQEIISSFLSGLRDGDGYIDDKDIVYSTSSRELAYGIQLLCTRLSKFPKIYKRIRDTNFKKNAIIYRIYESKNKQWKRWYKDDHFIYVPIKQKNISERTDDKVYDITVNNSPTFTIQNLSVFDCWYSPRCKKSDGHHMHCLTGISPEMVKEGIEKKLAEPLKTHQNIIYGKDLTNKGQDPIILVRRETNGLGDLLMTTPALKALKAKYPNKQIHVACQKSTWPVLQNNPDIDDILDVKDNFNYKRYFMVIDISSPCARYESTRVAAGKAVQKSRVEIFAEAMGVRRLISSLTPVYNVSEGESDWAEDFMKQNVYSKKPKIAIGVSSAEKYRNWPKESYETLFELLKSRFELVVVSPTRTYNTPEIVDACGFPLRKAIAVLSKCDGLITVDTSLLHFGAALEIPTIAIFGPIDYKARCKGYKKTTVIKSEMPCSPCWRNSKIACKESGFVKGYSSCIASISPKHIAQTAINKFSKA
jgi:heptosyltransferase-2